MADSFELPPSRRSRTLGALLALHAGDSLGSTHEFQSHWKIAKAYPKGIPRALVGGGVFEWAPGAATDDTDMTRAVLVAYHDVFVKRPHVKDGHGDVVVRSAERFVDWYTGNWPGRKKGRKPVDVGGATEEGITKFIKSGDYKKSGAGAGQAGNGSLMRCLPTGLFQIHPQKIIDESIAISSLTHDDRRCTVSCAAYNVIASGLIQGFSADECVRRGEEAALRLEAGAKEPAVYGAIRQGRRTKLYEMAKTGPKQSEFKGECSGYVLETLTLAVAAVLDKRKLEDILVDVVMVGNDTDTNAAVAGGLLGARDGMEGLPQEWKRAVQFGEEFRQLGNELLQAQGMFDL